PDLGLTRIPAPFALPDGLPLEGVSLSPDGSYNQFGCPSATCRGAFASTNGAVPSPGGPSTLPAVPAIPPAAPLPPSTLQPAGASTAVPLRAGVIVRVSGAGDCLNVRAA